MNVTHTISIKSNGRETAIILLRQNGSRFEVESIQTAGDIVLADTLLANAVTMAVHGAAQRFGANAAEPSPLAWVAGAEMSAS